MDKTLIGLLGASALVLAGGAQASAAVASGGDSVGLKPAQSFAELLDPIPNASGLLRAEDERAGTLDDQPVEMAQGYYHHHHHHSLTIITTTIITTTITIITITTIITIDDWVPPPNWRPRVFSNAHEGAAERPQPPRRCCFSRPLAAPRMCR